MNILSHYLQEERDRLGQVCHEWVWHISCRYSTLQELEKLQHQLQGTTDENRKKQLQQEISITQAKREVADSKAVR